MSDLQNAVANALALYAETSGMSIPQVGVWFSKSDECRQNIYRLVALQASTSPLALPRRSE